MTEASLQCLSEPSRHKRRSNLCQNLGKERHWRHSFTLFLLLSGKIQIKWREWANRVRRWGKEMGDERRAGGQLLKWERIMSHLEDKNSTVAVVFLLRYTLRSQQVTVKQGAQQTMSPLQRLEWTVNDSIRMYSLYIHATILCVWLWL